jgi:16S rRNA processing protein RimM
MNKVVVGKIVNTIGLKGELKIVCTVENLGKISDAEKIYINGFDESFVLSKVRPAGTNYAIKISGLDDINDVEKFKGHNILVDFDTDYELKENEFMVDDLVGSKIVVDGKQAIIVDVENYGAGDILVFELEGKEMRVPFVLKFFDSIDISSKTLVASKHFFEGAV